MLGAADSIFVGPDQQEQKQDLPFEILVYNFTGAGYCGYHYDVLETETDVPPPPAPMTCQAFGLQVQSPLPPH